MKNVYGTVYSSAILMDLSEPAIDRFIPNQTRTKPPTNMYIPAGDSGLFPATAEFLRITQDPSTESVARVSRARARAGICVSRFSPAAGELTSRS